MGLSRILKGTHSRDIALYGECSVRSLALSRTWGLLDPNAPIAKSKKTWTTAGAPTKQSHKK